MSGWVGGWMMDGWIKKVHINTQTIIIRIKCKGNHMKCVIKYRNSHKFKQKNAQQTVLAVDKRNKGFYHSIPTGRPFLTRSALMKRQNC